MKSANATMRRRNKGGRGTGSSPVLFSLALLRGHPRRWACKASGGCRPARSDFRHPPWLLMRHLALPRAPVAAAAPKTVRRQPVTFPKLICRPPRRIEFPGCMRIMPFP